MIKKLILILTFFLLINSVFAVEKPQKYMPYPIIFVSGIGTSANKDSRGYPSKNWPNRLVFSELSKYFLVYPGEKSKEAPKYIFEESRDNGEKSHLEFFFYDSKETPVDINANMLKDEIEKILSNSGGYYDTNANIYVDPCPTPKVIIIAHSYGSIITRYMLANNIGNIRNKVAAVFFLGAPQLGSPMAVIGYFLPKEIPYLMEDIKNIDDILRKEDFTDRLWDEINFKILRKYEREKVIGNLKFIKWAESEGGLYTSVRDIFDNAAIENAIADDYQLLALYRKIPPVYQKGVIWATLIPDAQANTYRKKFELYNPSNPNKPFVRYIPSEDEDDLSYGLPESVLYTLGTDIGVEKVHAIVGTKDDLIREYLYGKADGYMFGHFDKLDYSCIKNGLWDDGDGVINLASQKAIPGAESPNTHVIDAAHVSFLSPILLTGETDHPATPNIILQAIDDKPVIESAYAVPEDWHKINYPYPYYDSYYLVFKLKDYLLADIEVEKLDLITDSKTIDLLALIPAKYKEDGPYKPYLQFKKYFLQERDCDGGEKGLAEYTDISGVNKKYLHLMPGEFFVETKIPYNAKSLYIKIKNPAAAVASQEEKAKFSAARSFYLFRPKVNVFWTSYGIDVPPYRPPDPTPGAEPWPHFSSLYFDIKDSPTQDIKLRAWLYDEFFKDIPRKFTTDYITSIPWASSRTEILPDGNTQLTLHSGGFDKEHPFTTWYGEKDGGGTVPPYTNGSYERYNLKVTLEPYDADHNNNTIFVLGSGVASIAADPTFIQPSRREDVTW